MFKIQMVEKDRETKGSGVGIINIVCNRIDLNGCVATILRLLQLQRHLQDSSFNYIKFSWWSMR